MSRDQIGIIIFRDKKIRLPPARIEVTFPGPVRLEAIVDVQHHLIQRFEKGFLLRGVDIQVTLDSNGFAGEGDITLFGELLHRFFALYSYIHLFTQLTLILQPTGKCLQWTEHHSQRVPG